MNAPRPVLVIGYGNPGRQDDGLGPALADALAGRGLAGVTAESNYQLAVEDAEAVARHDLVVFADATVEGPDPFTFEAVEPDPRWGFTTHSLSPAAVLAMARDLFGATPRAFVLAIRGYRFDEFGEGLSERARHNLDSAVSFLVEMIIGGNRCLAAEK